MKNKCQNKLCKCCTPWDSEGCDRGLGKNTCNLYTDKPKESAWISIKDGLPEVGKTILAFNTCFEYHKIRMAFRNQDGYYDAYECGCGMKLEYVTHWMPLPEPPEELK